MAGGESGTNISFSQNVPLLVLFESLMCRQDSSNNTNTNQDINQLREKLEKLNETLDKRVHHIFYCSRTHAQLDQVVQELKRSNFLMERHGNISNRSVTSITQ